jgi:hypothetical protein
MNFEFVEAFLALLLLVPVVLLLRRSERRNRTIALAYRARPATEAFFVARTVTFCLFIAALTAVAARPFVSYDVGGSYLFLTDVSRSMQARHSCAEPTFLGRAKSVMRETLAAIPEAKAGIIAFDRFAFPITSMTSDRYYLGEVIDKGLYIGLTFEATRTDLANALRVVARKKGRLPDIFGQVQHVVLLSDGHIEGDYRRSLQSPIEALRQADISVLAVGIGNPDETPVATVNDGQCSNQHLEVDGNKVMIPLRADILRHIASETQGQYFAEPEVGRLVSYLRGRLERRVDADVETAQRRDVSRMFLAFGTAGLFGFVFLSRESQ